VSVVYLLGHPVSHSLSPAMQNAAFAALGLPHRYELLDVSADELAGVVGRIRRGDVLGANVTIPHKEAVVRTLDGLAGDAERLQAANTLVRDGERVIGHNTDAIGFERASAEAGVGGTGSALVLGAGGGARAVVLALLRSGTTVYVASRDPARADALAAAVRDEGGRGARAIPWAAYPGLDVGLVVNATPLGLANEDPLAGRPLPRVVADIVPRRVTPLLERARAQGCLVMDGLGMLLHQAAASFRVWTGVDAPLEAMRAALYAVAG
jgi:shikimate dehydrogenase